MCLFVISKGLVSLSLLLFYPDLGYAPDEVCPETSLTVYK